MEMREGAFVSDYFGKTDGKIWAEDSRITQYIVLESFQQKINHADTVYNLKYKCLV